MLLNVPPSRPCYYVDHHPVPAPCSACGTCTCRTCTLQYLWYLYMSCLHHAVPVVLVVHLVPVLPVSPPCPTSCLPVPSLPPLHHPPPPPPCSYMTHDGRSIPCSLPFLLSVIPPPPPCSYMAHDAPKGQWQRRPHDAPRGTVAEKTAALAARRAPSPPAASLRSLAVSASTWGPKT